MYKIIYYAPEDSSAIASPSDPRDGVGTRCKSLYNKSLLHYNIVRYTCTIITLLLLQTRVIYAQRISTQNRFACADCRMVYRVTRINHATATRFSDHNILLTNNDSNRPSSARRLSKSSPTLKNRSCHKHIIGCGQETIILSGTNTILTIFRYIYAIAKSFLVWCCSYVAVSVRLLLLRCFRKFSTRIAV